MKNALWFALVLSSVPSFAQDGKIENFFSVDKGYHPQIFRGREPKGKNFEFLKRKKITDVIVFKNDLKGEVASEAQQWEDLKITPHQIAFKWKDIDAYESCIQVLDALSIIEDVKKDKRRKVYFHCTVGQDRTGLLAGLWRIYHQNWSVERAFRKEMCERGYSDAIASKVPNVSAKIEEGLTPLFEYLAPRIKAEKSLDYGLCAGITLKPFTRRCRVNIP